jgi:hypothetical protein
VLAVLQRREHRRQAEGEHQHAGHLDQREHPEDPVVGVERRGEPRPEDPRPGHREHREAESEEPGADVVSGEQVRELVGGDAERDHERQVEEQLQRGRGAVLLVGVAPAHPEHGMCRALGHAPSVGKRAGQAEAPSEGIRPLRLRISSLR